MSFPAASERSVVMSDLSRSEEHKGALNGDNGGSRNKDNNSTAAGTYFNERIAIPDADNVRRCSLSKDNKYMYGHFL